MSKYKKPWTTHLPNKYLWEDTMEGKTIKTLAEYIVQMNNANRRLENPEHYDNCVTDTNGVEQDHVETFWPPDEQ